MTFAGIINSSSKLLALPLFILHTVKPNCKGKYDTHDNLLYIGIDIHKHHTVFQRADDKGTGYNARHLAKSARDGHAAQNYAGDNLELESVCTV